MKILVVVAHPNPESFNHAIAHTAVQSLRAGGHDATLRDLYAERFDPCLPFEEFTPDATLPPEIESCSNEVLEADGIVIVHPNWWGQPPAILKGWQDRAFRPGKAYKFVVENGEGKPVGLLKARSLLVFNTANTPADKEISLYGDPLQLLWKNCVADFLQIPCFHRELFTSVIVSSPEVRAGWLERVKTLVAGQFA